MDDQSRVSKVLLLLAGIMLALCVGMAIGGAIVFGVMQLGQIRSDVKVKTFDYQFDTLPAEPPARFFTGGATIVEVLPGSPAERAGLQAGDVIVAVDRQAVSPEADLATLIAVYEPGDRVTLAVQRSGGQDEKVRIKLGENPDNQGAAYLGVRYSSSSPDSRIPAPEIMPFGPHREFDPGQMPFLPPHGGAGQGVIVTEVTEDSPAADAGLGPGDIITAIDGQPLDSPQALTDAIAERQPGDRVTLAVYAVGDGEERQIEVRLGEHPDEDGRAYLGVWIGGGFRWHAVPGSEGGELPHGFEFRGEQFFFGGPEGPHLDELPFDWKEFEREFELWRMPHTDGDSL